MGRSGFSCSNGSRPVYAGRGILWSRGRLFGGSLTIEDEPRHRAQLTLRVGSLVGSVRVPYRVACWCYAQDGQR